MSDCSAGAQKSRVGPALPREIGENDMCARGAHRGVGNPTKSNQKGCNRSGLSEFKKKKENSASRGCKTPAADLVVTRTAGRHGPHRAQPAAAHPALPHPL